MRRNLFVCIMVLAFAVAFGGNAQAQHILGPPPDGGGPLVHFDTFSPYYWGGPYVTFASPFYGPYITTNEGCTYTYGFTGAVGHLPPDVFCGPPYYGPCLPRTEFQTVIEFDLTGLAGVVTRENYQSATLEGIRHFGWWRGRRIPVSMLDRVIGAENDAEWPDVHGDCNDVQLMDLCDDTEDGNATPCDFFKWWTNDAEDTNCDITSDYDEDGNCSEPVLASDGNLCIPWARLRRKGPAESARAPQNGDCNEAMELGPINVSNETRHDLFADGQDPSWAGFLLKSQPWAMDAIWIENGLPEKFKKPLQDRRESKNGGHWEYFWFQPDPHVVRFDFSNTTLTITTRLPGDECADYLDNDGVCSPVEDDCDSGLDVTPDREQCHVASFKAKDAAGGEHCITLEMPVTPGTVQICFQDVQDPNELAPPPPPPPSWVDLTFGLFTFKIVNLGVGNCTTVTVHWDKANCTGCADPLEPDAGPKTIWKYGPTPDVPFDHWYDFSYNGRTGAKWIDENTMVVYFCDGERGDSDLSENGEIFDPGGLAHVVERPILYFPYLTNLGGGFNADEPAFVGEDTTKLEMVNKSPYAVTGAITFYEADGTVAVDTKLIPSSPTNPFPETLTIGGVQPITIPGNGKLTLMPAEVPSNAVSAIVSADGDVVGFAGFRSGSGKRYAAPGSTSLTSIMTAPFFRVSEATGEGWRTGFGILNPGDAPVTVEFIGDTTSGVFADFTLEPKASHFLWVEDSEVSVRNILATGGTIAAVEVFEYLPSTGDTDMAAILLGNQNAPDLCVPALLFGSGEATSAGLGNPPGVGTATLSAIGYNAALTETTVSLGELPAGEIKSAYLTMLLPPDTLWTRITGDVIQALGSYFVDQDNQPPAPNDAEKIGTVNLNGASFKDGCFGVVSSPDGTPTFALVNPGSDAADVIAFAYDDAGATVASTAGAVTIGGRTTFGLTDLFGGADLTGATSIRVVSIESEEKLCGLQVVPVDGRWEGLPILQ